MLFLSTVTIVGPDLTVTKSDSVVSTTPGSALTYTIDVTNKAGPFADTATDVVVTDKLPEGVSFVSSPDASFVGFNPTTRELTWTIASLAPGAVANLSVNASVDDPAPAGVEVIGNTVTVSSDDIDPTPGDNTATDETSLDAAPDLSITKTDNRDSINPGDRLTYTIVVSNNGNQDTTGVEVVDTFDPGLFAPLTASQPAGVDGLTVDGDNGIITWQIDQLGAGPSITLTVNTTLSGALPSGAAVLNNTVRVSDDGRSGPDSNPGDETAIDSNAVPGATPDYVITKTNDTELLQPGETTTYTITVSNVGSQDGTGVSVVDN